MPILSVDLASKSYVDFGFCAVKDRASGLTFPRPEDLGVGGKPSPVALASALSRFCRRHDISVLLMDGPQGWRWPDSPIEHMRLCERVLNTPARTGRPGEVKPSTYRPFVEFSIELFRRLRLDHGWFLLEEGWPEIHHRHWIVETFPSACWRLLGLPRLPGKSRARGIDVEPWRRGFSQATGFRLPQGLSHDQLQAAVPIPAGLAIAEGDPAGMLMVGIDPILTPGGDVFEGWIALPLPGRRTTDVGRR